MATTPRSRRLLGSAGRPGVAGLATATPLSTVDAAGSPLRTAIGIGVVALCALLVIGIPLLGALINRHRRRALAAALTEAANRRRPPLPTPTSSPFRPVPPRAPAGPAAQPTAMVATASSPWPGAGPAAAGHPAAPRPAGRPMPAEARPAEPRPGLVTADGHAGRHTWPLSHPGGWAPAPAGAAEPASAPWPAAPAGWPPAVAPATPGPQPGGGQPWAAAPATPAPQAAPQAGPQAGPQAAPQAGPQAAAQAGPQVGPAAAPAGPRPALRPLAAGWRGGRPVAPGWETAPAAEYGSSLPIGATPVG